MNRPEVVVQAFFYKDKDIPREPPFVWNEVDDFLGYRLWKPYGKAVFLWAIDYVSCSDERWCVFGPMPIDEARNVAKALVDLAGCDGARIVNAHCFESLMKKRSPGELPQWAWTDG